MNGIDAILDYWFGDSDDDAAVARGQQQLWWAKNTETDAAIREQFEPEVIAAGAGELDHWRSSTPGWLALIILCDQFPRNIYRDAPRAFALDPVARALCLEGLARGMDQQLRPIQRVFCYLPLEHAEDLEHQHRAVALFQHLAATAADTERDTFDGFLDYALRHRAIIERFGRFPHRNAILGRESSAEEIAFLREPGSSF
ncbi:DUF924 family protein [Haliea sp. E1-2-M8]|uniref:DUF924 family protein n=1 Tax=Haliea sp. E1-2-M8 TaxID=3064706 RepID=UPI002720B006|nr:DUF924 family protein [Haliea sp. E1-2-M8]MDO8860838.1 DUF924 family protein [Haliea sp. E1-2-M8]